MLWAQNDLDVCAPLKPNKQKQHQFRSNFREIFNYTVHILLVIHVRPGHNLSPFKSNQLSLSKVLYRFMSWRKGFWKDYFDSLTESRVHGFGSIFIISISTFYSTRLLTASPENGAIRLTTQVLSLGTDSINLWLKQLQDICSKYRFSSTHYCGEVACHSKQVMN